MTDADMLSCPLCFRMLEGDPSELLAQDPALTKCRVCGTYEATPEAYALLKNGLGERRYILSGRARMAEIETGVRHRFDVAEIQAMRNGQVRAKTFSESALSIVRYIAAQGMGKTVRLEQECDHPVGYCKDFYELKYLVSELANTSYLGVRQASHALEVSLSGKGWRWLEEQIKEGTGQQVFIAMSFSDAMAETAVALKAGISAAGYRPVLVSDREFSDGIVDRIFTEIRRSRFVVADFTENKAGVYYEAGFGLGLGLTVIGTCEVSHLDPKSPNHLHFDVRGLNMIPWTVGKLDDLSKRLTSRILAKFPQGPAKPEQQ